MHKRLFLVANPSQYLNAVELSSAEPGYHDSVVVVTEYIHGINEINKLNAESLWQDIFILDLKTLKKPASNWLSWRHCMKFLKSSFRTTGPDELVLGNLGDTIFYSFYLVVRSKITVLTVLDDGTPTINLVDKRIKRKFYSSYHLRGWRIILKSWLSLGVFLPAFKPPFSIRFFSLFKLDLDTRDSYVRNDYNWLRTHIQNKESEETIYFVGSHIVNRQIVLESDFLQSLKHIKTELEKSGKQLIYVHHRGESHHIRSAIAEVLDTVEFSKPLEFVFIDNPMPAGFMGHFSTALFTLSRLYPVPVTAFIFPEELIIGSIIEPKDDIIRIQRTFQLDVKVKTITLEFA